MFDFVDMFVPSSFVPSPVISAVGNVMAKSQAKSISLGNKPALPYFTWLCTSLQRCVWKNVGVSSKAE